MSRKGENIYKRKDGRWEARYIKDHTPQGKAVYGYVYAKGYREVKEKLRAQLLLAASEPPATEAPSKEGYLFQDAAQDWFDSVLPHVKESTENKYRNILQLHLVPALGKVSLAQLTTQMIEAFIRELLQTGGNDGLGLSPKTVADILCVIRSIVQYASANGKNAPCNTQAIQIKRCTKDMRVFSRQEQYQLCQFLFANMSPYNMGILMCLFTGIRIGELCALKWEDISIPEQTIHIHQTLQRIQNQSDTPNRTKVVITAPKSTCSIRTIPIPNHLSQMIAEYKNVDAGFFLTNRTDKYVEPRVMQNHFKKVLELAGISPANFHTLRHTFATRCIEVDFDVKSLSEILGHSSVTITMNRYVHPSMELKKKNMQRLTELFAV